MAALKDLSKMEFNESDIYNMIHVEFNKNDQLRPFTLFAIFEAIKKDAIESGLTVEMKDDRIMFIKCK